MILNGRPCESAPDLVKLALYGQAIFTTMLMDHGKVKGLSEHIARLERDALALFGLNISVESILTSVSAFITQFAPEPISVVRVTVFPADFDLAKPEQARSLSVLVTGRPQITLETPPSWRLQAVETWRSLVQQKSVNMIPAMMARKTARQAGADDALLVQQGVVAEGPTWNVFFLHHETVLTPSLDTGILPGITRNVVLTQCRQHGLVCQEQRILASDLGDFTAAFATNATYGIIPIKQIDNIVYSQSPTIDDIRQWYSAYPGEGISSSGSMRQCKPQG